MSKTRRKAEREFDKKASPFKLPSFESPEDLERLVAAFKAFDDHESYIESDTDVGFANSVQQYQEDLIEPEKIFDYYMRQPFNGLVPEEERAEIFMYYPMFEITSEGMIKKISQKKKRNRRKPKKVKKLTEFEQQINDFEENFNSLPTIDEEVDHQLQQSIDIYFLQKDICIIESLEYIDTTSDLCLPDENEDKQMPMYIPDSLFVKFDSKTSSFQVFRLINLILDRIKSNVRKNSFTTSSTNWYEINSWMKFQIPSNNYDILYSFKFVTYSEDERYHSLINKYLWIWDKFRIGRIKKQDQTVWNRGKTKLSFVEPIVRFSNFLFNQVEPFWFNSSLSFYFNL